jgi:hypothetical protein
LFAVLAAGCASAKKTVPELSRMEGKKVALIEVDGEDTPRKVVEVALVNQLVERGSFELIGKREVQAARDHVDQGVRDWKGIARRAGAEVALKAKVLEFSADTREGYSSEQVEDSQLAEETGTDGKTERVYKVKGMHGKVRVQLTFFELATNDERVGVAEADEVVKAEGNKGGIHLPPKLRFLETLSNQAFKNFFEKYD